MGSTVCRAVSDAPDMELVAAVDPVHAGTESGEIRLAAGAHQLEVAGAQVAVDFTVLDAARENIRWCAAHGVHAVVGTTGFPPGKRRKLDAMRPRAKQVHRPSKASRPIVSPGISAILRTPISTPGMNEARSYESWRIDKV